MVGKYTHLQFCTLRFSEVITDCYSAPQKQITASKNNYCDYNDCEW